MCQERMDRHTGDNVIETMYLVVAFGVFLGVVLSNGSIVEGLVGAAIWPVTILLWIKGGMK